MPVVGKKRHTDEETGVVIEGTHQTSLSANQLPLTAPQDYDLIFPDDEKEKNPTSFKFLQMAHKWKQAQAAAKKDEEDEEDEPPARTSAPTSLKDKLAAIDMRQDRDDELSSSDGESE